jgi:polar amino acid transport system substrate-binding protein
MKKTLSVFLAAALAFGMIACSNPNTTTPATEATTTEAASNNDATTEAADAETTEAVSEGDSEGEELTSTEIAEAIQVTGAGVKTPGTLVMSTNAEFPPYEYHDSATDTGIGDFAGIDVEIAKAIAEKMGCELKIEDIAFDSIVPQVNSGMADMGMAGMTVNEDRKKNVDFSESYAVSRQVIVVKEDSTYASIEDLAGKRIGVQQGTTGDILASDDNNISGGVERYNKAMEAVQSLSQGMIDAVIVDIEPAKVFVSEVEGLKILDQEYTEEEYAICVKKGNTELLDNINAALKALKDDGTLDAIVDKYINAK